LNQTNDLFFSLSAKLYRADACKLVEFKLQPIFFSHPGKPFAVYCSILFLKDPSFLYVHLLPGILRKHLPTSGREEGSEDFCPVFLEWLWLLPGCFPDLLD
jgi:hypothetical protein